jgi:hypothetical protein
VEDEDEEREAEEKQGYSFPYLRKSESEGALL